MIRTINGVAAFALLFGPALGIFWFYFRVMKIVTKTVQNDDLVKRMATMSVVMNAVYFLSTFPYAASIVHSLVTGG